MQATLIPSLSAGTELDIVNAARRSFDTEHMEFMDTDARLIRFLIREGHWLPFRHPQLSFSCDAPVFVARQLGKHQIGLTWSEVSRRYKTENIILWEPMAWRQAPENAKQGTGPTILDVTTRDEADMVLWDAHNDAVAAYNELLDLGVAPEQARAVLPQSMMVKWTWTGSLLAWLHLYKERSHSSVQTETRQWVFENIIPILDDRFPITMAAVKKAHNGKAEFPK